MSRLFGGIIELNSVGEPIPPELILAYRSGSKQGVISNAVSISVGNHMADADEISFDVHKYMDGVECPLWSDIKDFKLVYVPQFETDDFNPWYELEVTVDETDETVKHCEGVHLQEAELSQLTLNNIEINTETDIARDDYVVTVLYNPDKPEGSLLNRILNDKASHYEIYHVDSSLVNMQRTFSWDGNTIKDAFDDIAEELECIFVYGEGSADGKLHRTISVYDLNDVCLDCGERGAFSNKVCTKCGSSTIKYGYGTDTGIFINHENFASSIDYSSNKDEVKNCFRLVAGDDLMTATVRNINPNGSQYIWYISDDTRNEMSPALRSKLEEYDAKYEAYSTTEDMNISESTVNGYNSLVNKYKSYDSSLATITYPVKGYSALTDFYYQALNLYSLLYTSLAPASAAGNPTTAKEEIKKLTSDTLSPLGLQNASTASATTVSLAVANYARVYIDTSLYKLTATTSSYSNMIWKGTITLESYTDEEDTAATSELSITITDATADFIKCQIEKAMKKNDTDATGTVALFKMSEADFKTQLGYYSVSNLNILASIVRGCLDVMIEQGVADNTVSGYADLYNELYLPYYNKSGWIQDELKERESEVARIRGSKDTPTGALDYIEKERQAIANILDLRSYLGETLWAEFSSFRRDDEYHNENFISDGLTDTELISHAKEFYKYAQREIVKSATLQHTISCNLNDLLLVREQDVYSVTDISAEGNVSIVTHDGRFLIRNDNEFSPLLTNFDTGNWIRVEVDGKVYKLRMTDYQIDYDDLSDIDVDFSDVIYGLGYMSDTQDILSKASSMATSYSATVKQASKGNSANQQITNMVENGLSLTNSKIVNAASNQNLVVDESGMLMREKNEYGNDYSNEQIKIINHGFYYTSDNWATVKTGMGKFIYYDPETGTYKEDYGLIARKIVGNIILGNEVSIYNSSGSVKIDEDGFTITADADDINKKLFTLRRKNEDGSYTNYIYVDDDGNIRLNGRSIIMTAGDDLDSYIDKEVKTSSSTLVVQLSNDYAGVPTDTDGNNGNYNDCYTEVVVFSGITDITSSSDVQWVVTAASSVVGSWDKNTHRYTVTNLTTDVGQVVFDISYSGNTVTKTFKISKVKAGATGIQGAQGEQGIQGEKGAKGDKGDTGEAGKSIGSIVNWYLATSASSGVTPSTSGWTTTVQSVTSTKKYLWNYEVIKYSDGATASASTPCIIGVYGDTGATGAKGDKGDKGDTGATGSTGATGATGNGISSIVEHYAVSTSNTTAPTTWYDTVQTMTVTNKYLWNYETITYTDKSTKDTLKRVIGVYGDTGATGAKGDKGDQGIQGAQGEQGIQGEKGDTGDDGVGIASIIHYYALSDSSDTAPTTWTDPAQTTAVPAPTESQPYLWGYDLTTYTDGSTVETTKHVIGARGENGNITEFKEIAQDLVDDAKEDLQSQIKKESDAINQTINDKTTALSESMTKQLDNYKAEVGQYLSFGDDGLSLGASGSDFKTVLDNQRLSFKDGDTTVAYASNKQFYMPEAVIEKALKIGKYKFVPHNNNDGGMSIIWEE